IDLPVRQRTMRGTLEWSHALLGQREQALFRRLSVFSGGAPLDAIERVCLAGDQSDRDVLQPVLGLVEKNLLSRTVDTARAAVRVTMLETVREYARELLDEHGETDATARAHAAHYLALAEAAERELVGPGQAAWIATLNLEHDNLRSVLRWALEQGEAP